MRRTATSRGLGDLSRIRGCGPYENARPGTELITEQKQTGLYCSVTSLGFRRSCCLLTRSAADVHASDRTEAGFGCQLGDCDSQPGLQNTCG